MTEPRPHLPVDLSGNPADALASIIRRSGVALPDDFEEMIEECRRYCAGKPEPETIGLRMTLPSPSGALVRFTVGQWDEEPAVADARELVDGASI